MRKLKDLFFSVKGPKTFTDWFKNKELVMSFRSNIRQNSVLVAMGILKDMRRPTEASINVSKEVNSNSMVYYAGYCQALDDLQAMSKDNVQAKSSEGQLTAWDIKADES